MGTAGLWIGFTAAVLALLALDLGVFNRRAHVLSLREAAFWSLFWVALSLGFGCWILLAHGKAAGLEFFTGYLIEKSLSLDNIFVFLLVFRALGVQSQFQHRVLFWGVLGALLLRGMMIGSRRGAGAPLCVDSLSSSAPFCCFAGRASSDSRTPRTSGQQDNPLLRWAPPYLPRRGGRNGAALFRR